MKLFYSGNEIPTHRTLLNARGVENVALSWMGLRRRTKFTKPWLVKEKFGLSQNVFLDSGAYTVNSHPDEYDEDELIGLANDYMTFVSQNIDDLYMVSEFDARALGKDQLAAFREDFYDDLPPEKFMPIWNVEEGLAELDSLSRNYERVGISQSYLGDRNLAPVLNSLVQKYGTRLHGMAMTKPEVMQAVKWDTVASTSWLSPAQFGDTIVWTGNELKRYPKKYKEQARKRHRTLFTANGFDADAIANDDPKEILHLSIWSWQQVEESINRKKGEVVTHVDFGNNNGNVQLDSEAVDNLPAKTHNSLPTLRQRDPAEIRPLPVMGITYQKDRYKDEHGILQEEDVPVINIRSESARICDSCFLASKCPMFEPGANCAYNIPIEIKTKDQVQALFNALVEMQAQRVLFMKMVEDQEGGYVDANLSNEIDRLKKLIESKNEMEREGFSLKIEASGQMGKAGVLSRIFGDETGAAARALPAPQKVDNLIEETGVFDAEIVQNPRDAR